MRHIPADYWIKHESNGPVEDFLTLLGIAAFFLLTLAGVLG